MASTENCPIAAMADEDRRFYAVQFHPEVTHTVQGEAIIAALCTKPAAANPIGICLTTSPRRWRRFAPKLVATRVILGLSGGVDSSVAAALIHRAIGDQLTCVFVDHGLLRLMKAKWSWKCLPIISALK